MSTSRLFRTGARVGLVLLAGAAFTLAGAGIAAAHVTAQPGTAEKGGYTKIAFRVPDESDTAGTVKLQVMLPTDHPIASVRTTPTPGWTAEVTKAAINPPITDDDGTKITEAPASVTWTAQPGTRIGPTEFVDFELSMGALPDNVDQLVFPAVQTYDDGTVVRWDQPQAPGAREPEHPAPVVKLVDKSGEGEHGGVTATDDTARWLGGLGLVVGALGLGLGVGAVARGRRPGGTSGASGASGR